MFLSNLKNVYSVDNTKELNSGNTGETVALIAVFVIAAIIIGGWITTALMNKGADVAACIEGANVANGSESGAENCAQQNHAGENGNSFKDKDSYASQFGLINLG